MDSQFTRTVRISADNPRKLLERARRGKAPDWRRLGPAPASDLKRPAARQRPGAPTSDRYIDQHIHKRKRNIKTRRENLARERYVHRVVHDLHFPLFVASKARSVNLIEPALSSMQRNPV